MADKAAFLAGVIESIGGDPSLLRRPDVTVVGHRDRAENRVTAGYLIGEHLLISCDPAVETMLRSACADLEPALDSWLQLGAELEGEYLATVRMQLLRGKTIANRPLPDGYNYRSLRSDDSQDRALISDLIDNSTEDDLDESEVEMDNLDDVIEVVIAPDGEIAAFASAAEFDLADGFGDIGVLTRTEHRQRGLGIAAVSGVCARLLDAGRAPVYRCDEENSGSVRLSASLGFEPATRLVAYRFSPQ